MEAASGETGRRALETVRIMRARICWKSKTFEKHETSKTATDNATQSTNSHRASTYRVYQCPVHILYYSLLLLGHAMLEAIVGSRAVLSVRGWVCVRARVCVSGKLHELMSDGGTHADPFHVSGESAARDRERENPNARDGVLDALEAKCANANNVNFPWRAKTFSRSKKKSYTILNRGDAASKETETKSGSVQSVIGVCVSLKTPYFALF